MSKVKKFLIILLVLLIIMLASITAYSVYYTLTAKYLGAVLAGILFIVIFGGTLSCIIFCVVYFGIGKKHKCPTCGKRFVLKKINQEIVNKQNISVLVETNTRNRYRDITGTVEQYVPGERITYQVNYVCKKCGEKCNRRFTKDIPHV